jgi:hypothetical protein
LEVYGSLTGPNSSVDAGNGTIEFKGSTTAQTISGVTFKDRTIKDLRISNASGLNLSAVSDDTLNITGTVNFGVGSSILTTNNNLTLKSTAAGTASVGVLSAGNEITGDVAVERFINVGTGETYHGKSWQSVATPAQGQTVYDSWMEGGNMAPTGYHLEVTKPSGEVVVIKVMY